MVLGSWHLAVSIYRVYTQSVNLAFGKDFRSDHKVYVCGNITCSNDALALVSCIFMVVIRTPSALGLTVCCS